MLDLYDEFRKLVESLNRQGIDYAVCGGLAMAVHALPRATVDIDLLILTTSLSRAKDEVRKLGYVFEAGVMSFARGQIEIHRLTKPDPDSEDYLSVDMLIASPDLADIWSTRQRIDWEGQGLWVVSREGLIQLKQLRGSGQDQDDIRRLLEEIRDDKD